MPGTLTEIPWKKSAPSALVDAARASDDADLGRAVRKIGLINVARVSSRCTPALWQPLWSQSAFESTARSDAMAEHRGEDRLPLDELGDHGLLLERRLQTRHPAHELLEERLVPGASSGILLGSCSQFHP